MWKELVDNYITERPLTGYGYGGFWTTRHVLALSLLQRGTVYYHSHSGYLEMALSIGVVGAVVHVLTLVMTVGISLARGVAGSLVEAFGAGVLIMLMIGMGAEPVNMSAYLMPTFLAMILISKHAFLGPKAPVAERSRVIWSRAGQVA
jgi:O-antigen ligase